MEIKDVLHLYLGCDIFIFSPQSFSDGWYSKNRKEFPDGWGKYILSLDNIDKTLRDGYMPLLRPLSDIKPIEHEQSSIAYTDAFGAVYYGMSDWYKQWHGEAARINYLRSKGIDIDGLIESGQAIDKTLTPSMESNKK